MNLPFLSNGSKSQRKENYILNLDPDKTYPLDDEWKMMEIRKGIHKVSAICLIN